MLEKHNIFYFCRLHNLHYEKFADGNVKCIEDEIPFELPEGWAWSRLLSIIEEKPTNGYSPKGVEYITNVRNLTLTATTSGFFKPNEFKYVDVEIPPDSKYWLKHNDILIQRSNSRELVGTSCIYDDKDFAFIYPDLMMKIHLMGSIDVKYIDSVLKSTLSREYYIANATGSAGSMPKINQSIVANTIVPLPPYAEQKRLVRYLSDVMNITNIIESGKPDILELISKAKFKILDLAIRGQLVPQDPNDEPASVLLERIKAEKEELIKQGKIKRDNKESVIFRGEDNSYYEKIGTEVRCINSEIPFDLPETWCWCRLGTLFAHNTGKALNSSDSAGTPMTYITTSNLYWDRFELDSLKEMPFTDSEIDKCTVTKGDLLVCEGGDIGRSAIWMFDENIRIQNHIHRLRPYISLSCRFYYYVMYMWKRLGLIGGQGIGLQGFSSKALHNLIVPLPSIDEQERIVASVDKLFATIANIENRLS